VTDPWDGEERQPETNRNGDREETGTAKMNFQARNALEREATKNEPIRGRARLARRARRSRPFSIPLGARRSPSQEAAEEVAAAPGKPPQVPMIFVPAGGLYM
jgi:hypothetical protein